MKVAAFSGGKDSTAMVLELAARGEQFKLLHTATGNELPGVAEHIRRVARYADVELIDLHAPTLQGLIEEHQLIPNWRMRWCTRVIKIEPVAAWLTSHPHTEMLVGLRADEQGRAGATFDTPVRYPLREWNWGLGEVLSCCATHHMEPPQRTDCAVCFFQTLYEWYTLWKNYPEMYEQGVKWETDVGHTFRSDKRDSHPASLADLRKEFEKGFVPQQRKRKITCRICSA